MRELLIFRRGVHDEVLIEQRRWKPGMIIDFVEDDDTLYHILDIPGREEHQSSLDFMAGV